MRYSVEVAETISYKVNLEADSEEEAKEIALERIEFSENAGVTSFLSHYEVIDIEEVQQ